MKIQTTGVAGTIESSDVQVTVEPNPKNGIEIHLKSKVERQYGRHIRSLIEKNVALLKVTDAIIRVEDQGALDAILTARLQAAIDRAANTHSVKWEERV